MRIPRLPVVLIALATIALQQCATRKEVPYTYPTSVTADLRGDFVEQFQRGEVLYALSCGGCHNKRVGRKTIIPDFSAPQLLDYEMRIMYPEHGKPLHESKVSKDELDDIQVFLLHRKPSGHPITPPPVLHPPKVN